MLCFDLKVGDFSIKICAARMRRPSLFEGVDPALEELIINQMFLHFNYWDELPDMQDVMGTDLKWAATLVAQHLLAAADRYALQRLRTICESQLCEGISINTVATNYARAEQHHCFQLKAAYLKFISLPENLKAVMETDGFDYLKEGCPCLLSELLEYVVRLSEHSLASLGHGKELYVDGCDVNGRRVKQSKLTLEGERVTDVGEHLVKQNCRRVVICVFVICKRISDCDLCCPVSSV